MDMNIVFFISETLLVISYMMASMILLRLLVCFAQFGFIFASLYFGLDSPGMLTTFIFSFLTLFINSLHVIRLLYVKIPVTIPNKYKTAYKKKFKRFSPREFLILMSYAKLQSVKDGYLIKENTPTDIIFVINGKIQIIIENQIVNELSNLNIIGEISFLTNSPSIASVKADGIVEYFVWSRCQLQKLEKKYPNIFYKFYDILLKCLAIKLSHQNRLTSIGNK